MSICAQLMFTSFMGVHFKLVYIVYYRYPDVLQRPNIPSTVYTRDQAVKACDLTKQILDGVSESYLD